MKKGIIIIITILILMCFSIVYLIKSDTKENKQLLTEKITDKIEESTTINETSNKTSKIISETKKVENETTTTTTSKVVQKNNDAVTTSKIKPSSLKTTTVTTTTKNKTTVTTSIPTTTTSKQVKKKIEVWEALGISEDDYKNKPALQGEKVDFKSFEECFKYGYSYEPYMNGEETFNCSEVKSLSGNFLGIMFSTEKNIKDKS